MGIGLGDLLAIETRAPGWGQKYPREKQHPSVLVAQWQRTELLKQPFCLQALSHVSGEMCPFLPWFGNRMISKSPVTLQFPKP